MSDQLKDGKKSGRAGWFGPMARGAAAAGLALLLAGGLGASCAEDDFPTEREQPGGPTGPATLFDAGADAEESICPIEQPKLGGNCPPGAMQNLSRCTFVIGVCQHQGSSYDITVDYCCSEGALWDLCGTNTTPCDREVDASVDPPPATDGGT
jgi:hypothetical protein